ncbi:cysteine/glutathione ABC transporter permease/ATP-binding protein CydD [Utexia brackfieldae]|uniref:heme ABC transporter permease/ATP-binding protein CydD n=1 Tax=Utexia brackfieldae TaxID=3074108 RepID=UPI00370D3FF3
MSLDKIKQKQLLKWLKQQASLDKTGLRLSVIAGLCTAILIIAQAWLLATILQLLIIDHAKPATLLPYILIFIVMVIGKALVSYLREQINFHVGLELRRRIRKQVLDKLELMGPAYLSQKTTGNWSTLLIEQIEDLQDFYARYLPQMKLATMVPILIVIAIFPINWVATLILLITAPLIPLFMVLVGMGAADVNRRHFLALGRLSGHFLDRLKSLNTIRLFGQGKQQADEIHQASEDFREKTMEVLRMAFLSSGVLEFFTSVSIAVVAVYFGFSYLGELHFGAYSLPVSLFAGFFALILAPEFFQPLRDLGSFYHAKAQAIAAADNLQTFLEQPTINQSNKPIQAAAVEDLRQIEAQDLVILSSDGQPLLGPISFSLKAQQHIALMGKSGAGKTSLINVLLGFLPYQGSLTINGIELNTLDLSAWREQISWLGQNPYLPANTVRENLLLANPNCDEARLNEVIRQAHLAEFIARLPEGLDTPIGDDSTRLSVGQAQRIALARALLKSSQLLILDEPTASLDNHSRDLINQALHQVAKGYTVITVTHQTADLTDVDEIWQLQHNHLHIQKVKS